MVRGLTCRPKPSCYFAVKLCEGRRGQEVGGRRGAGGRREEGGRRRGQEAGERDVQGRRENGVNSRMSSLEIVFKIWYM